MTLVQPPQRVTAMSFITCIRIPVTKAIRPRRASCACRLTGPDLENMRDLRTLAAGLGARCGCYACGSAEPGLYKQARLAQLGRGVAEMSFVAGSPLVLLPLSAVLYRYTYRRPAPSATLFP